jgi:hypothetical protein
VHLDDNIKIGYFQVSDDDLMYSLSRECMVKVGVANYARMKEVSQKYDPKRTFQDLCSGAYELDK